MKSNNSIKVSIIGTIKFNHVRILSTCGTRNGILKMPLSLISI